MQRHTTSIQRIRVYLSRSILTNQVLFILGVYIKCLFCSYVFSVHLHMSTEYVYIYIYIYIIHFARVHMTRPNHVFLRVNSSHRHSNDSCFARNQELVWTLKRKTKYISNFPGMNVDATGPCSEPCVSKKVACFRPLVKLTSFLRSPHSL